ncbi:prostatic acid phosphatase-like [Tiliqua scincoides]|uniref:prostatic acid phosphatase-like n=1 Tax=Tiliqua scincoides TaxID=71010 RepID=UPI0034625DE5
MPASPPPPRIMLDFPSPGTPPSPPHSPFRSLVVVGTTELQNMGTRRAVAQCWPELNHLRQEPLRNTAFAKPLGGRDGKRPQKALGARIQTLKYPLVPVGLHDFACGVVAPALAPHCPKHDLGFPSGHYRVSYGKKILELLVFRRQQRLKDAWPLPVQHRLKFIIALRNVDLSARSITFYLVQDSPARMGQTGPANSMQVSLLSLVFVGLLQLATGRELTFVLLIYRHGDRSPIENYPKGLHNEGEWPQGYGQLTTVGMQQQYELGQYIRERYAGFLSPEYKREEVLIESTELDRTIMSALSNLAGLFPPSGDQIWNPDIHWQPIPVHIVPKRYNPKLRFPIFDCPLYLELLRETMASNEFQARIQPYEEFLKQIALFSGYDLNTLRSLDNFKLWHVQDSLFCESVHNFTLPEWATEDVRAKLADLTMLSLSSLFGIYKRVEKARLQGGLLVKSIVETLFNAAQYPETRKMLVYSAHDTTLGALQIALNIYNERLPPYAACQIFELYKEDNGQHTIEMHFRNDTSKEPYRQTLPGCSSACPVLKFAELVQPIITFDWRKECVM